MADNSLNIKRVSLAFQNGSCVCTLHDDQGEHRVVCGLGNWKEAESDLSTVPLKLVPTAVPKETKTKLAGSGAWSDENTFTMTWRFIETAHYENVTCRFSGDDLRLEFRKSLAVLSNTKDPRPVLEGKLTGTVSQGK